jgi:hypothetical protein
MRMLIRPGSQSYSRVTRPGEYISHQFKVQLGPAGARYDYITGASPPQPVPTGTITQITASLLLKFDAVDKDGNNWDHVFSALEGGDTITIGTQTGTILNKPFKSGDDWTVSMVSFPVLVNGEYIVKVVKA